MFATRTLRTIGLAVVAAALTAAPLAAQKPKPAKARFALEIINDTPGWFLDLRTNSPNNSFVVGGPPIEITVKSEKPGHLYLFNIDANGDVLCLFPNVRQRDTRIPGGQDVVVPPPGTGLTLKVDPRSLGTEYVKAVVTRDPIPELDPALLIANQGYKTVELMKLKEILLKVSVGKARAAKAAPRLRFDDTDPKVEQEKLKQQDGQQAAQLSAAYAEANLTITTAAQAVPVKTQRFGLFVGVNKFKDQSIRELFACTNDASKMYRAMQGSGGIPEANAVLLTDTGATLAKIRGEFDNLVNRSKPGDTVVIYWSGHGGRCANVDGTERDGMDAYLVPHDGSIASDEEARRTMLLDKTFARWIQELAGRHVAVILDTCHSGGQIEGMKMVRSGRLNRDKTPLYSRGLNMPPKPGVNPAKGAAKRHFLDGEVARMRNIGRKDASVLSACTFQQFSFERPDKENGVMTYYLLEALTASGGGQLGISDLHRAVADKVSKFANDNFPGSPQTPVFSDETANRPIVRP